MEIITNVTRPVRGKWGVFSAKNARIIVAKTTTFLCYALDKKRVELCRDTNCGQILNEWLIPPRKLEQILPEGETGKGGTKRDCWKVSNWSFCRRFRLDYNISSHQPGWGWSWIRRNKIRRVRKSSNLICLDETSGPGHNGASDQMVFTWPS